MSTPPAPESSGLPLRALSMVLLSAAIVFAGLGFLSLSGSDADAATAAATTTTAAPAKGASSATTAAAPAAAATSAAPTTAAAAQPTTTAAATTASDAEAAALQQSTPVRVYNNSTVEGLAGDTAATLRSDGWTVAHVGNYDEGEVPHSAVFYGPGTDEKAAAEEVGAQLGLPVEPRFAGISDATPGVIVILTAGR